MVHSNYGLSVSNVGSLHNANNKRAAFEDSIDLLIDTPMLLDVSRPIRARHSYLEAAACTGVESTETLLPMEPFTLLPQQPVAPVHDKSEGLVVVVQQSRGHPKLLGCLRLQLCLDKHQGRVSKNQCNLM